MLCVKNKKETDFVAVLRLFRQIWNIDRRIIFASLAKCTTNILPSTIFNLCMVQDPKELQNLNSGLIKGERLAHKIR